MKKLWIELNTKPGDPAKRVDLKPPKQDESAVTVQGVDCQCGASPLIVQGAGMRIASEAKLRHDHYTADAVCRACYGHVGKLYAKVDTLFGLEEDEAVARSGVRIY